VCASSELAASGLQMSQLPMHDATRDMIMVGEHLMAEMNTSHKLDQANKMLAKCTQSALSPLLLKALFHLKYIVFLNISEIGDCQRAGG
jgi:hypothetical protein